MRIEYGYRQLNATFDAVGSSKQEDFQPVTPVRGTIPDDSPDGSPKFHFRGVRFLLLFLVMAVAAIQFFEQPAPGAGIEPGQQEFFLPQFATGQESGISLSSDIVLLNMSSTSSPVFVDTRDPSGESADLLEEPNGQPTNFFSVDIPANGSILIQSAMNLPGFRQGYAGIFSFNGQVVPQAGFQLRLIPQSTNSVVPSGSEGMIVSRAQVPGRQMVTQGSFSASQTGRTGFAMLNLLSAPFDAEVTMGTISSAGDILEIQQFNLVPGQRVSMFIDELFDVSGGPPASVEFRSNLPLSVLPLVQNGLVLTSQDVFPPRLGLNN